MDRRTFLAILLTAIVIVGTPLLFPTARQRSSERESLHPDTVTERQSEKDSATVARKKTGQPLRMQIDSESHAEHLWRDTTVVGTGHSKLVFSRSGAVLIRTELSDYRSLYPGQGRMPVTLTAGQHAKLIGYKIVIDGAPMPLDTMEFKQEAATEASGRRVKFSGSIKGHRLSILYDVGNDSLERYMTHVKVSLENAPAGSVLQVLLPETLASAESDTMDDINHLALAYKTARKDVESIGFTKLDTGRTVNVPGPLPWVAVRNKYFLVSAMAKGRGIGMLFLSGEQRENGLARSARGIALVDFEQDSAKFDLYTGPQEFQRLHMLGDDLDQVNPYAGWTHSIVQPFAAIVTRVLLWMKKATGVSYGWVIVVFGVVIRILLWPLNQSAMRTSIRMQRLQPELAEVQARYKNEPEKQRDALVKLYAAHGMTPFSPMMGCLPLLLPMPIVLALYFVFQNTIEFRGVPFLWLPDISASDPYYVTPLFMGLSMFGLSWIGMRGTPPTPQTRMMSYMMPVVLTVMFLRFAAGLNLYYAVQNIAALPQQWLLSRERLQASGKGDRKPA